MVPNQSLEQIARDHIDDMLKAAGWSVQNNQKILKKKYGRLIKTDECIFIVQSMRCDCH